MEPLENECVVADEPRCAPRLYHGRGPGWDKLQGSNILSGRHVHVSVGRGEVRG